MMRQLLPILLTLSLIACHKPVPIPDPTPSPSDTLGGEVKIPLAYVAEYNVGQLVGSFATSHDNAASGYFSFAEIDKVCPPGYHTPTCYEAAVLFPKFGSQFEIYLSFGTDREFSDVDEAIQYGAVRASYCGDYRSYADSSVSYALRFKQGHKEIAPGFPPAPDNAMLCAYRYEVVGSHTAGSRTSHLEIRARYLGTKFSGTIDDIAHEEFWSKDTDCDIRRIIPANIYYHPQKRTEIYGMGAYLWTSTVYEPQPDFAWTLAYIPKMAYISYNARVFKFGIRPFEDAPAL